VNAINIGQILTGPLFNEPMRVETVASNGSESAFSNEVAADIPN